MTVRARLTLIGALSMLAGLAIAVILFVASRQIDDAIELTRTSARIAEGVAELTVLTQDYLRAPSARALAQWHLRHRSLVASLGRIEASWPAAAPLVAELNQRSQNVFDLFTRLTALEPRSAPDDAAAALHEILVTELLSDVHLLAAGAFRLSELGRASISRVHRRSAFILLAIVTGLTAIVALVSGLTYRGIIAGLSRVSGGAKRISEGDLGHRVGMATPDEMGALSRAIDEMAMGLERAQEELVRKERLAVLGQLAGGVSHELRNPLGVIKNAAYYLQMVLGHDERARKHLAILDQEVATATRIITGMLDYARITHPSQAAVDVNGVVREGVGRAAPPDAVTVDLRLADHLPAITVDPDHLALVVRNLAANGAQAMPDGGTLTVETQAGPGEVVLVVSDTGSGITSEHLPKVFEPLFSTKRGGIGLGLAVVKNLVEANGGQIAVESPPGQGARFVVRFRVTPGAG